ncbi:MAG TPA: hypothetical protein VGN12_24150 [Pirellulales bacterium]|jgi:hypothetical protein
MSPEDLIGHLLNLLSQDEHRAIAHEISIDQVTCVVVDKLRQRLTVLEIDHIHFEAPAELARCTCETLRRFCQDNPVA